MQTPVAGEPAGAGEQPLTLHRLLPVFFPTAGRGCLAWTPNTPPE